MPKLLSEGYEIRGLTEADWERLCVLLEVVFNQTKEYFACIYRNFPGDAPEHSRAAFHRGEIVSHVHAFPVDFRMNGVRVPGVMIGDVGTHPDHRRKGLGRALMEDACRFARERYGSTFGLLRSGVARFYGSVGWDVFPVRQFRLDVMSFEVPMSDAAKRCTVRRFERAEDTDAVRRIHEEFNRGRSLTVVRPPEFWHRHFYWSSHHEQESLFLVAESEGKIVAYSRANLRQLLELCHAPGREDAAFALLESTIRQLRKRQCETFGVVLPEDHCVVKLLDGAKDVEVTERRGTWLRQIDWGAMLECFGDVFAERLTRAGLKPARPIALTLGGQTVTLLKDAGGGEPLTAELSQIDAFRLITGAARGSTLLDDAEVGRLLDCLFEPNAPIFWPMDVV